MFAFLGPLVALNGFADVIRFAWKGHGPIEIVYGLGGLSAVIWFALYAIVAIAWEGGEREPLRRDDRFVAAGALLASFVPVALVSGFAVLGMGIYLFATSPAGSRSRRVGTVLLALTGPLVWGRAMLTLMAPLLLGLDARLVGFLSGMQAVGNTVRFAGTGNGIFYIAGGCSSVHNISLAVVLWAALTQLLGLKIDRRLLLVCGVGMVVMLAVNAIRLVAIARYPEHFAFLHEGVGAIIFGWTSLIAAGAVVGLGTIVAARPRA